MTSACAVVLMVTGVAVGAASEPVPAVTVPGVMTRLLMSSTREVVSMLPASPVKFVAVAERLQAASVPRALVTVHSGAVSVDVLVFVPSSTTSVMESGAKALAEGSRAPTDTIMVSSGISVFGAAARRSRIIPVEAMMPKLVTMMGMVCPLA